MFITLSPASPDPMYKQITDQVRDAIAAGELAAGEKLPSVREMSEALKTSAITVKRAYLDLENEGCIISRAGLGSFVAEVEPGPAAPAQTGGVPQRADPHRPHAGPSSTSAATTWCSSSPASRRIEMEPVLKARDLCKSYEGFSLAHLSLNVFPGSILGIFGPNGAGKTTLIKLLAGQMPARLGRRFAFSAWPMTGAKGRSRTGSAIAPRSRPSIRDKTLVETRPLRRAILQPLGRGFFLRAARPLPDFSGQEIPPSFDGAEDPLFAGPGPGPPSRPAVAR